MKILKIQFKNINSLKGEHEIDFTQAPLKEAGLFAITGPTGSGKSTILDVIALALYNKIPRIDSSSKTISKSDIQKTGSIITRNTNEAFASVQYSCAKGEYISRWSISTARTGNLRDYQMEIQDVNNDTLIDLKKSDVPDENAQLIGLNYEQFVRAIMLAQGAFSTFLFSNKKERGDLLEKITGTSIYRKIGRKVFEKFNVNEKDIRDKKNLIANEYEKVLDDELFHEKNRLFDSYKIQEKALNVQLNEIKLEKTRIEQREFITNRLNNINARIDEKQIEKKVFLNKYEIQLNEHEKLLPIEQELKTYFSKEQQVKELLEKEKLGAIEITSTENDLKSLRNDVVIFTGEKTIDFNVIEVLSVFKDKINILFDQKINLNHTYKNLLAEIKSIGERLNLTIVHTALNQSVIDLKGIKNDLIVNQDLLKHALGDDVGVNEEDSILLLEKKIEQLHQYIHLSSDLNRDQEVLENFRKKENKLNAEIAALPERINSISTDLEQVALKIQNKKLTKQNMLLKAKYEHDRHRLIDGEPCPLCGALEHPFLGEVLVDEDSDVISSAIIELEKEQSVSNVLRGNLENELTSKNKILQQNTTEGLIVEDRIKVLLSRRGSFEHSGFKDKTIDELADDLNVLKENRKQLRAFYKCDSQIQDCLKIEPVLYKLIDCYEKGIKIKSTLKSFNVTEKSVFEKQVNDFENKWIIKSTELDASKKQANALSIKVLEEQVLLGQLSQELNQVLVKIGDFSIQEAHDKLMSSVEYNKLINDKVQFDHALIEFKNDLKHNKEQLQILLDKGTINTINFLESLEKETNEKLNIILPEIKALNSKLILHNNAIQSINKIKTSIDTQDKLNYKWRLLNEMIGDAQGKTFSLFAQQLTLEQLVVLANKRLTSMNSRYHLAVPDEVTEDDFLTVLDLDMAEQRRSVKTLSGGESFLMSLSLALALSDLASRTVKIQSLFIDEGFGSLDQVTLDQTIDTLERLQAESDKTIGVISHVEALKERINTQIQISQDGRGYSTIQLRG